MPLTQSEKFMARCIELAKKAKGYVSPNPLVGSVITRNGEIISEDYHRKYGEFHAERNAILKMGDHDYSDCEIYVNLEPCTHHGKTPPCLDLIIEKKFKKVIFGMFDPNPLVAGKSIEKLRNAGITYEYKVLQKDCEYLNRFFIKHITNKLPWIVAKYAQSSDGFISSGTGKQEVITGIEVQEDVHKFRAEVDAIIIGKNTAEIDDPSLTVRLTEGKNPKRIVIDKNLDLSPKLKLFSDDNPNSTIVIYSRSNPEKENFLSERGVELIKIPSAGNIDLSDILKQLGAKGINSLIVEGGSNLLTQFCENNLIDEVHEYTGNIKLDSGLKPFTREVNFEDYKLHEEDTLGMDKKRVFIKMDS